MTNVIAIFVGAGFGGVLRYWISLAVAKEYHGSFPMGTFLINLAGCFAIGYLATFFFNVLPLRETLRLGILVGVLGGFTTFSSFGRETFQLMGEGKPLIAFWYVILSNVFGIGLVWAGHLMAKSLHPMPVP